MWNEQWKRIFSTAAVETKPVKSGPGMPMTHMIPWLSHGFPMACPWQGPPVSRSFLRRQCRLRKGRNVGRGAWEGQENVGCHGFWGKMTNIADIAMDNDHLWWVFTLKMVISKSYVKLPEDTVLFLEQLGKTNYFKRSP